MEKFVIYLSGPMSGLPDNNFSAFMDAEAELTRKGFAVMNPAKLDVTDKKGTWIEYIIRDLPYVALCDAIYLLRGWENSWGARIEVMVAVKLDKPMIFQEGAATDITLRFHVKDDNKVNLMDDEDFIEYLEDNGIIEGPPPDILHTVHNFDPVDVDELLRDMDDWLKDEPEIDDDQKGT